MNKLRCWSSNFTSLMQKEASGVTRERITLEFWKNIMLDLYCVVTENCNLKCRHCYMSAGPRKKHTTIDPENFRKLLRNLPVEQTKLALSGGEILTEEAKLRQYIADVEIMNESRGSYKKIEIELQTNGFWLKRKNAVKLLQFFKEKKIQAIDITSDDRYHSEQKLELTPAEIQMARSFFPGLIYRGVGAKDVIPLGRAKTMENKSFYLTSYDNECKIAINQKALTIRNNGKVYPCCYPMFSLEGNVFEEPLETILKRAKKHPRFQTLRQRGLRGMAIYDGVEKDRIDDLIKNHGVCGACYMIYGQQNI